MFQAGNGSDACPIIRGGSKGGRQGATAPQSEVSLPLSPLQDEIFGECN